MKILIVPDKFKDSLASYEVCDAIEIGLKKILPDAEFAKIPLADGGEDSLDILENSLRFKRICMNVSDPLFRKIRACYGILKETAYIEMAKASGLQLLDYGERNPLYTSSFGTGELIVDAINRGAKKIFLFVGGSATNDCGIGIASALGYNFKDESKKILEPIGKNLQKIKYIDKVNSSTWENVEFTVLTDVENILFGENGAAYVYAKQKGASNAEMKELDEGLQNISEIIKSEFNIDISKISRGGAAGGVGAGLFAFVNAKISSGVETIFGLLDINDQIKQSDLVITGEGLLDKQTLEGKVVNGIIDRCKTLKKPLGIICGDTTLTNDELRKINAIIKRVKTNQMSKEESIKNAFQILTERSEELIKEFLSN